MDMGFRRAVMYSIHETEEQRGARKTVSWLEVLAALPEDLTLGPCTRTRGLASASLCSSSSGVSDALSWQERQHHLIRKKTRELPSS